MDKIVIIPTYRERENIGRMIEAVMALPEDFHVLVIDDNSPDGTALIVRSYIDKFPSKVFMLERRGKLGLGTAYITGFKWSLDHNYEYIFEMDADFSHNPKDLSRLYKACRDGADVSIGSRYVDGGKVENWPVDRVLLSKYASVYVRMITWMPIKDTTAGFKCYTRKVLESIDLDHIKFVGYAFQIEMKFAAWKLGFKLVEVPITFVDRVQGVSKMSKGIFNEAIFGVIKMKWYSFFHSYRGKKSE